MIRSRAIVLAALAAMLFPIAANAAVRVNFVAPESYRDSDFRHGGTRAAVLSEFRQYFQALGESYLKPGQNLTIDVLDIDLAGEYEPWRANLSHARIMRDITPPMMKLRYRLEWKGRVLRKGIETVSDMNYLMNPSGRRSGERLVYDKEMLRDWFQTRFGGR
jgi:Protein of unknown function (DUF3016)